MVPCHCGWERVLILRADYSKRRRGENRQFGIGPWWLPDLLELMVSLLLTYYILFRKGIYPLVIDCNELKFGAR